MKIREAEPVNEYKPNIIERGWDRLIGIFTLQRNFEYSTAPDRKAQLCRGKAYPVTKRILEFRNRPE